MKTSALLILPFLFLAACSTTPGPRTDMTVTKPIQNIAVTDEFHVFAQNDVILEPESMDKTLAGLSPEFATRVEAARSHDKWSNIGLYGQLGTLAACLISPVYPTNVGFCLVSVGLGLGVAIPQSRKAMSVRQSLVVDYNKTKN